MKSHICFMSLVFVLTHTSTTLAKSKCYGRFVNPITHVAWKTLFPLTIGGRKISDPLKDKATPPEKKKLFCKCKDPIPRIGIPIGFWEPFRLADVTRKPFCMVNLGGMDLNIKFKTPDGDVANKEASNHGHSQATAFYHVHWYIYPLLAWLNLLMDLICMQSEGFDVAYMTEFDPAWQDDEISIWINPEAALFGNPIAQIACTIDCATASVGYPINLMYWCAGCQGGVFPLTGTLTLHEGGADASTVILQKMIFKLHRQFLLHGTIGVKGLCGTYPMPWWKKNQYKLQMTYPRITKNSRLASNPIGRTTWIWGLSKQYPIKGEDFGYLVWRRRNCCAF